MHGGAAPAVPPLALCPPTPPDDGPPAEPGAPLLPAVALPAPEAAFAAPEKPAPEEPALGCPAALNDEPLEPLEPLGVTPSLLWQELSCKMKIRPVKAKLKA